MCVARGWVAESGWRNMGLQVVRSGLGAPFYEGRGDQIHSLFWETSMIASTASLRARAQPCIWRRFLTREENASEARQVTPQIAVQLKVVVAFSLRSETPGKDVILWADRGFLRAVTLLAVRCEFSIGYS